MTRYVVLAHPRNKPAGSKVAVHGPFRSWNAADARATQIRRKANAIERLDLIVYVERIIPGGESIAEVLEAAT